LAPLNNFTACIQARLGSSRLPEKVLKPLAGKPMLECIANQISASVSVRKIVLTTSDSVQDDRLAEFAERKGYSVFRGPVDDIVSRLHGSLQVSGGDGLIRVWGDCPFVCPDVIDSMVEKMVKDELSFIHNSDVSKRSFPPGLDIEIYRKDLLEKMNLEVKDLKLREFPVEYVKAQKNINYCLFSSPDDFSHTHLTVDYPEDLSAAEELYFELQKQRLPFTYPRLLSVLKTTKIAEKFSHASRNIEYKNYLAERKAQLK
jgi:spore coat polysaccharide biosynthesis protein SpsF (cytidylyltransferase family)